MSFATRLVACTFLAAGSVFLAAPLVAQQDAVGGRTRHTASDSAGTPEYSSREADFVVGKSVYLRSTKTRIGRILAVDENRSFPASFRRRHSKAVLIRRFDGPIDWVPVDGITRIYVTR